MKSKLKTKFIIYILVICITLLNGCNGEKYILCTDDDFKISESYRVSDTIEYKNSNENNVITESADTAEDVVNSIEEIWFKLYGEDEIKKQRPYNVCYDKSENLWYVYGNRDVLKDGIGGVANAIISKDTGEVLATWHGE